MIKNNRLRRKKFLRFLRLVVIVLAVIFLIYYLNPMNLPDKDGFVIKGWILYAYLGDEREIQTPKNVRTIYSDAFASDLGRGEKLRKVTVTKNVKKIDEKAFAFTSADVIVIEEGVKEIGTMCFMDSYIREIYFPSSIKKIGSVILETEEGLFDTVLHCVEGSKIAEYLKNHPPYGRPEIRYDYEDYFK